MTLQNARLLPILLLLLLAGPGCAAIEGIFKAGLWVGLIIAVIVIALVLAVMRRLRR